MSEPEKSMYVPLDEEEPTTKLDNEEDLTTKLDTLKKNSSGFWNEGSFKCVTRRIDEGARVLEDLSKMMHERAEIENLYASKLKGK